MNGSGALPHRLAYEPGRNAKLRLLTDYFRTTADPDRGYALAAITGALSFRYAKPGLIRTLIAERTDPALFALSYDYVGDLSETVALMWPIPSASPAPDLIRGLSRRSTPTMPRKDVDGRDDPRIKSGDGHDDVDQAGHGPTLSEVVTTLASLGKSDLPAQLAQWLDDLDEVGRWALLKLVTGAMRIGVSARLAKTAVAALGDRDADEIEIIWPSLKPPYGDLFAWLEGRAGKPESVPPAHAVPCHRRGGFR